MNSFVKIIFHLLPLVGIFFGKYYLAAGLFLLVLLPYIKIKKINLELISLSQDDIKRKEELEISLKRIGYFVFLKNK